MNMYNWIDEVISSDKKKSMPILSFPGIQFVDTTVRELVNSSQLQEQVMCYVADKTDCLASVSLMDLSVEAEAFGSQVLFSDNEVPTVVGAIVTTEEEAEALAVPKVGVGRTSIYIDAICRACKSITDRPVFAGVIGPFSLAGRLMEVTEAMVNCYVEPDMVHIVLKKVTEFLIEYISAYKDTGASGVVMAEPLAGLLSPDLEKEFSAMYVKQIVEAVQTEDFIVIYHNCGGNTPMMIDSFLTTGCRAFHFGDAIDILDVIPKIPSDKLVMGNISPSGQFKGGTPQSIKAETIKLMESCCKYPNFVISSGCDIPHDANWDNITAFFEAVNEFYSR